MAGIKQKLQILCCPECGSVRLWRDGLRYTEGGPVQRWLCRNCGYRFTLRHNNFSTRQGKTRDCRVGVPGSNPGSKNSVGALRALKELEKDLTKGQREPTKTNIKTKLFEYAWHLQKKGRTEETITSRIRRLKGLAKHCNLLDPESVKETLAKRKLRNSTKAITVSVYNDFLKFLGLKWDPPEYKAERSIPFIPLEREIDDLIASCNKRIAALLQLLKETGARIGEAAKLKWTDFDVERRTIRIHPEKGSNPRLFHVSEKLAGMLNGLPKKGEYIFSPSTKSLRESFNKQRKRAAVKLNNPRLNRITFHTIRHWKGTMEYHKTKDPWHVKRVLGHKTLKSTEVYINIEQALFEQEPEEFHVKATSDPKEIKQLLEVGFEYVCSKNNLMFFRKRK